MAESIEIGRKSLIRREDYNVLDYGKLPPQCRDLEEGVIGACLLEKRAIEPALAILKNPDMFYVDAHQRIWRAIMQLWLEEEGIDILTVVAQLKKHGELDAAGGAYYVSCITNKIGSAAHVETHAMLVKEAWVRRELIANSTGIIKDAFEDMEDTHDILSRAQMHLENMINECSSGAMKNLQEELDLLDYDIQTAANRTGGDKYIIGRRSGIYSLDRVLLGLNKTDLIIFAGRPSEGKTTLLLQALRENARAGIPAGMFSLEMSYRQVLQKIYAMEAGIDLEKIRCGTMDAEEWGRYNRAKKFIATWPLHIHDVGGLSVQEMKAIASMWHTKHKIEILGVDYIQLATCGDVKTIHNREQEVSYISRNLKGLAKSLDIPVIALSQMSRDMEKRTEKDRRPVNSDLRDTGALEQDADVIAFIYRPEMHGIEKFTDGTPTKNVTEIIISKNRMGPLNVVKAHFSGHYSRFTDATDNFPRSYSPRSSEEAQEQREEQAKSSTGAPDDDTPF